MFVYKLCGCGFGSRCCHSKRVFQENKARQIFQKTRTFAYQGVRNVRFSENLTWFVFLKHPFWDRPFFALLPTISSLSKLASKTQNEGRKLILVSSLLTLSNHFMRRNMDEPSKIYRMQPLKNLSWYNLFKQIIHLKFSKICLA